LLKQLDVSNWRSLGLKYNVRQRMYKQNYVYLPYCEINKNPYKNVIPMLMNGIMK